MNTELRVLGDKVLFIVDNSEKTSASGIILPASVEMSKRVISGLVNKTGPGYPLLDSFEAWKESKYWPISVKPGDYIYVHEEDCVKISHSNITYAVTDERSILIVEAPCM